MKTKKVEKPDFATLVKEANKKKIDCFEKDRNGLFFSLAGDSKLEGFEKVGVFERNISEKEMKRREDKGEQIPQKTVYQIELESKVLAIIEKNPLAFNGYDFTNDNQTLNYTFSKKVQCYCGNTFDMVREYQKKTRTEKLSFEVGGKIIKEDVDIKYCDNPTCLKIGNEFKQRKWIYLEVPETNSK